MLRRTLLASLFWFGALPLFTPEATAAEMSTYQMPTGALKDLINAPTTPGLSLSPSKKHLLMLEQQSLPTIADLSQAELRLAGLRLNPDNFAPSRSWQYVGMHLKYLDTGAVTPITGLPEGARMDQVRWSPDGKHVAFALHTPTEVQLWVIPIPLGEARRLGNMPLNDTYGTTLAWLPDSSGLIVKQVVAQSKPMAPTRAPSGPNIQENKGKSAPARTYQDLLQTPHDEALFEYYTLGQLVRIALNGDITHLGQPGIIRSFSPSPNGHYVLVEQLEKPFSYSLPASRFPHRIEVWDRNGLLVHTVAKHPLLDQIPISFDATMPGRREVAWRNDVPATLYWIEALDKGDPSARTRFRDRLFQQSAPFVDNPKALIDLEYRFENVFWSNGTLALVYESWNKTRQTRAWRVMPDQPSPPKKLLEYSSENLYLHPGSPVTRDNEQGATVLMTTDGGKKVLLTGPGASPQGNMPFLDKLDVQTGAKDRMWRSQPPILETPIKVLDGDQGLLMTRRESLDDQPNYYLRDIKGGQLTQLTQLPHPTPQLKGLHKQRLEYTRADGVKLNAMLYTPPGYDAKKDGPLPTLLWAYPREFKSADAASQVNNSPYEFTRITAWSPLVFLAAGYAILDGPAMPIIGEGQKEPNDTYVEQLVASAKAAIDAAAATGKVDPNRMAVGGHSYGAFMTANLLAHSDLFRAGIARSGAYNRTLTPFGFQAEERTLWQAPGVYSRMSPLMYADQIKEPLLLIHGEADNNTGTYPIQSQYFYQALKGNGGTARLVMLPNESHAYRAHESIGHMLWEMVNWLDTYVKNVPPRKG